MHHAAATLLTITVIVAGASEQPSRPVAEISRLIDESDPGAVIIIPPGHYTGSLVVRKAVTLDGAGRVTIDGGGVGTVVELRAPGITLRDLTVRGSAANLDREPAAVRAETGPVTIENLRVEDALFGIDLRESPGSVVRGNTIRGKDFEAGRRGDAIRLWWSHGCRVENNEVVGTRDMVFWYSEGLTISGNTVSDSRYGLHFMYSHDTLITGNDLSGNSVGVYLMYSNGIHVARNRMSNNRGASGYGIGLKDCDDITLEGNAILANRVGLYIDNSPSSSESKGLIRENLVAFNETGLLATPITHGNEITRNAFVENEEQAASHGRGELTANRFASRGVGNFWSDYSGFDRDGDGIGDLPHEPRSLFYHLLAGEPNLRLFVHSPAQQAIEFTARAFPDLRPSPTLTDPAPLANPPALDVPVAGAPARTVSMALLAAGLVGSAGAVSLALARQHGLPAAGRPPTAPRPTEPVP